MKECWIFDPKLIQSFYFSALATRVWTSSRWVSLLCAVLCCVAPCLRGLQWRNRKKSHVSNHPVSTSKICLCLCVFFIAICGACWYNLIKSNLFFWIVWRAWRTGGCRLGGAFVEEYLITSHSPCYQRRWKGSDHGWSACLGVAYCTRHESAWDWTECWDFDGACLGIVSTCFIKQKTVPKNSDSTWASTATFQFACTLGI